MNWFVPKGEKRTIALHALFEFIFSNFLKTAMLNVTTDRHGIALWYKANSRSPSMLQQLEMMKDFFLITGGDLSTVNACVLISVEAISLHLIDN